MFVKANHCLTPFLQGLSENQYDCTTMGFVNTVRKATYMLNDNLVAMAQVIYRKTFVDHLNVSNLPEGWYFAALGDVAYLCAGGDKPSVFSDFQTESCPVSIFSNGIKDEGLYGYTDKAKIFEESVTVSARGTVGYVFLREVPYVPIVRLISVIPKQNYITAKYLYFALSSIDHYSTGTSQQQITVPDLKKRQILVPNYSELSDFMSNVEPLFALIRQNKAEIKANGYYSGGIVGSIHGRVINCYNKDSNISGESDVGGIVRS